MEHEQVGAPREEVPLVDPVDDLMDVCAGTGSPVDALSGSRPSPFTAEVMARQRARAYRREDLTH